MMLTNDGAAHHPGAALSILSELHALVRSLPADRAGLRLHGLPALPTLLQAGPAHAIACGYLGPGARQVRAILFDKSAATNWSLGWHQDRTVAVRARVETAGYGPWSVKQGIQHVEPPFGVIEAMATLGIHLDDVPADNASLMIVPGSHWLGKVAESGIDAVVARLGEAICLAAAGDIWAYATPIIHASAAAIGNRRRRVLQIDYAAHPLDGESEWLGI